MIDLYCRTGGRSNDLLHRFIRKKHPPVEFAKELSAFGAVSDGHISAITAKINRDGYCISPFVVPDKIVSMVMDFATSTPARLTAPPHEKSSYSVYSAENPLSPGYVFDHQDIVLNQGVQELLGDPFLLRVAGAYLGCAPVFDALALSWSALAKSDDCLSSALAQQFHFDMDRIKWLKILIYLTDVDKDSGPHCYVSGTHKAGSQPKALLERGYQRISDADIVAHYGKQRIVELTGRRGTVIFVDTRGYHKGKPPISDHRLLLIFSFSSSLFGGALQSLTIPEDCCETLKRAMRASPRTFRYYAR